MPPASLPTDQFVTRLELAEILERAALALRDSSSRANLGTDERQVVSASETPRVRDRPSPADVYEQLGALPVPSPRNWIRSADADAEPARASAARWYEEVEIWQSDDASAQQFCLGYVGPDPEKPYYGRPRGYWVVHEVVNRRLGTEIAVFIEADQPTDFAAVIRGNGPTGRSMFAPDEELPGAYEPLTVDIFRDRIIGPQAYNKMAVVALNGDRQAMLTHAAIQQAR